MDSVVLGMQKKSGLHRTLVEPKILKLTLLLGVYGFKRHNMVAENKDSGP